MTSDDSTKLDKRVYRIGVIPDAAQHRDSLHGEFLYFVQSFVVNTAKYDDLRNF